MAKVEYDFIVEYAKTDRSTCSTSRQKIMQGEMRIGLMIQAKNFDGKIPQWYVTCINLISLLLSNFPGIIGHSFS
jgi:hypothetical protein